MSLKRHVLVGVVIVGFQLMAYAKDHKQSSPVQAHTGVKKRGKRPSEYAIGDKVTFAGVTAPMSPKAAHGDVTIDAIDKLTEVNVYTGGFAFTVNGLIPSTQRMQPKDGAMFVKVVLDFYSSKSDVLWKDDVALLSSDGSPLEPVSMIGQPRGKNGRLAEDISIIGFDGLEIRKGGNRIAIISAGKDADPATLHLRIRGKDLGSLASLK
jgi:hypothetical protein